MKAKFKTIAVAAMVPVFMYVVACKKSSTDDVTPATTTSGSTTSTTSGSTTSTTSGSTTSSVPENTDTLCSADASICKLPFRVSPTFLGTGVWGDGADQSLEIHVDTTDGSTPAYMYSTQYYKYTKGSGGWTGVSWINDANGWNNSFLVSASAKQITFQVKGDANVKLNFIPLGDKAYGAETPVIPSSTWTDVTLDITTVPTGKLSNVLGMGVNLTSGSSGSWWIRNVTIK